MVCHLDLMERGSPGPWIENASSWHSNIQIRRRWLDPKVHSAPPRLAVARGVGSLSSARLLPTFSCITGLRSGGR